MKTNFTHSKQFRALWEFFAKHGAEVEARETGELLPDQEAALAHLASGKADHAARMELIPLLRSNRKALAFLGQQIKLMRPSTNRKPRSGRSRASRSQDS